MSTKIACNIACDVIYSGMVLYSYPIAVKKNVETGEINGWVPDLLILARGKTEEEMLASAKNLVREYLNHAIENDVEMPESTVAEEFISKWREQDGFTAMSIDLHLPL